MMFVGIGIGLLLIRSIFFGMSQSVMSIGGTIFMTVTNAILSLFMMIYMILVFINIDSIKKNSPGLKDELMIQSRDTFYQYCLAKNILTYAEEVHEPNIIE